MGHGEGEAGEEDDLQQVEQEVVHVEPRSKLEPLLVEQRHHQRVLQETLTLVLHLQGQRRDVSLLRFTLESVLSLHSNFCSVYT